MAAHGLPCHWATTHLCSSWATSLPSSSANATCSFRLAPVEPRVIVRCPAGSEKAPEADYIPFRGGAGLRIQSVLMQRSADLTANQEGRLCAGPGRHRFQRNSRLCARTSLIPDMWERLAKPCKIEVVLDLLSRKKLRSADIGGELFMTLKRTQVLVCGNFHISQ